MRFECTKCGVTCVSDDDEFLDFDNMCLCDDDRDEVGDIVENHIGLAILTPNGWWQLNDEQVLSLMAGMSNVIMNRLTRPWTNDDPSTILSRGRRTDGLDFDDEEEI